MIGISALQFDIQTKQQLVKSLNSLPKGPYDLGNIQYIEYGADSLEDMQVFAKEFKGDLLTAFHLPLKTNPVEDILPLRKANLQYVTEIIKEGLSYEPLYFNMHLGHVLSWKYDRNPAFYLQLATEYIQNLLGIDSRVKLYIENVYTKVQSSSGDLVSFGVHPEIFDELLSRVNSPRLGFCYDLGHDLIMGSPFKTEALPKESLLHFSTNQGDLDQHLGLPKEKSLQDYIPKAVWHRFKHVLLELPVQELEKLL